MGYSRSPLDLESLESLTAVKAWTILHCAMRYISILLIYVNFAQGTSMTITEAPRSLSTTIDTAELALVRSREQIRSREPLTRHVSPSAAVVLAPVADQILNASIGDVLIYDSDDSSRLSNATIETNWISQIDFQLSSQGHQGSYGTIIWADDDIIGYLIVDPPMPDPSTRFRSLALDPLMSGVPSAFRSLVNLSSLISQPADDCLGVKSIEIYPVSGYKISTKIKLNFIIVS